MGAERFEEHSEFGLQVMCRLWSGITRQDAVFSVNGRQVTKGDKEVIQTRERGRGGREIVRWEGDGRFTVNRSVNRA
jgi:hypothetical protein